MSSSGTPDSSPAPTVVSGLTGALSWYDDRAKTNQVAYQLLRLAAIVLAAAIAVLTTSGAPALATAIVGSSIVVIEGVQQVFRYHDRYIGYRAAWNTLDREQRLYHNRAGRYADDPDPDLTLAERFDQIVTEENTRWAMDMKATLNRET
jgi:Protein of unknown function (DUF4231)